MSTIHVPHVPHWHPTPRQRQVVRDVVIAAELALVTVAIGVEGRRVVARLTSDGSTATPTAAVVQPAPIAAEVAPLTPTIAVEPTAAGAVVRVAVPIGGESTVSLLDATGTVVTSTPVGSGAAPADITVDHLAPGRYRVVVDHRGGATEVGEATISSAISIGSTSIDVADDGTITIVTNTGG
jgi:hypothetical protein